VLVKPQNQIPLIALAIATLLTATPQETPAGRLGTSTTPAPEQKETGLVEREAAVVESDRPSPVPEPDARQLLSQAQPGELPTPQPPSERRGPWDNDLMIARSKDGLEFKTQPGVFVSRAHVPTVAQGKSGRIIALFQWFPLEPRESFDRIAACFSSDNGKTWTKPKPIRISGIPGRYVRPCDPALVVLPDGRLRLYFTCDLRDGRGPACLSALSDDGLNYECEPGIRFSAEGGVLDPTVVRIAGKWHYYAPGPHRSNRNYHAVSSDGLNFKRAEDIVLRDFRMLGGAVAVEGGCRFYDGLRSAFSPDGYRWKIEPGNRLPGPDPGVVRLKDGNFLAIYGILRKDRRPAEPPPFDPAGPSR
jgi:hypothetical protein